MTSPPNNSTLSLYPHANAKLRLFALWYFAVLMIAWNVAGHTFLGFEQAWIHPVVAVLSAVLTQFLLEWLDAKASGRRPRFTGSLADFINYLPPAMITGFACAMLLYPNERLAPIIFAAILAIASKVLFRIPVGNGRYTHFLNPSNFGIAATLLLLPDVGQAPPYQFTENITGLWHWLLPALILISGVLVHGLATGRLPLIMAWLIAFIAQGIFRAWLGGSDWYVPLMPMSSAGFILFTLYMIPDPATTPIVTQRQVVFGASVAVVYAVLQLLHIVFGLFLSLIIVCVVRGACIHVAHQLRGRLAVVKGERAGQSGSTRAAARTSPCGLSIVTNCSPFRCAGDDGKPEIYRPRITFRDTNVVGNVYYLTYFRWQFEAFFQWLGADSSKSSSDLRSSAQAWVNTKWNFRFMDPVGATVGDSIEIRTDFQSSQDAVFVASTVTRSCGDTVDVIARGEMELNPQTELDADEVLANETEPGYLYVPQWRSAYVNPLELLSWQGTCRELFLMDHAPESLRLVAERQLALQTTSAELRIHRALTGDLGPVAITLRLNDIKCGQLAVRFDYTIGEPGKQKLLATGFQTMSSKHFVGSQMTACPIPVDILLALKQFTTSTKLLEKIDEIVDFSRSQAAEISDAINADRQLNNFEKSLAS